MRTTEIGQMLFDCLLDSDPADVIALMNSMNEWEAKIGSSRVELANALISAIREAGALAKEQTR